MRGAEPIFIDKKSKIGILMLHGFTSTPDEFKELSVFFANKGFTVYAPLIKGHGTSPEEMLKTSAYDWANSVKEAYAQLKEKTGKVFLIGNSFGSDLAFWLIRELNNEPIGVTSLGAPIFLQFHNFILFRLYTYGRFKKFYQKPPRIYKTDYIDMIDEVTYSKIPVKNFRQFLDFIKKEIKPHLKEIKIPALVVHSNTDPVVNPKSATYIYGHLGSNLKRIYWFESRYHTVTEDSKSPELFARILSFLKEVSKNSD